MASSAQTKRASARHSTVRRANSHTALMLCRRGTPSQTGQTGDFPIGTSLAYLPQRLPLLLTGHPARVAARVNINVRCFMKKILLTIAVVGLAMLTASEAFAAGRGCRRGWF